MAQGGVQLWGGALVIRESVFNIPIVSKERNGERDAGQYLVDRRECAECGMMRRAWDHQSDETALMCRNGAGVFLGKLRPMPAGLAQWRFQTHAQPIRGSTCYLLRPDASSSSNFQTATAASCH